MPAMTDLSSKNQSLGVRLLVTSMPPGERAEALARSLVERGLAACVHCQSAGTSVYRWQGETVAESETLMWIKTAADRVADATRYIADEHPYELPEVLVVPVDGGLEPYLDWVAQATRTETNGQHVTGPKER